MRGDEDMSLDERRCPKQTYLQKLSVIKEVFFKIGEINLKISDGIFLTGLRRRIKQQEESKPDILRHKPGELHKCFCHNNAHLTLEETFDKIVDVENSRICQKPLSTGQIKAIASIVCENIVTMPAALDCDMTNNAVLQILKLMPVMLLKRQNNEMIILNLHEFVYTPGAIEALLLCSEEGPKDNADDQQNTESLESAEDGNTDDKPPPISEASHGQPPIAKKFPEIINVTADFVKQHGFAAQSRRRTEVGTSSGVSVADIRKHLLENVRGLKEHGISLTTIRRLFCAPNKTNIASHRYKALIDARVGTKRNSYREYHPDSHYLFARNKQHREFCTLFDSDASIISMDDMAKVKVGAPAVSRYYQIRRIFPSFDMPNLSDHDFPVPIFLSQITCFRCQGTCLCKAKTAILMVMLLPMTTLPVSSLRLLMIPR